MGGRLEGVRAIVTGASRGLGRAVAVAFAGEGARLVLTARYEDRLRSALAQCADAGAEAHGVALDLGDPASVDAAAYRAVAMLDRVDVLVNNAGVLGPMGPLMDCPPEEFAAVMAVNLNGTVRFTQRVLPAVAHGGAVVIVTSAAAGRPGWGPYAASKYAVEGVTRMLRKECEGAGIRVVAVNPGGIRTRMRAAAHPEEDPATVPHPSARAEAFVALAAGADPGWRVEAAEWP